MHKNGRLLLQSGKRFESYHDDSGDGRKQKKYFVSQIVFKMIVNYIESSFLSRKKFTSDDHVLYDQNSVEAWNDMETKHDMYAMAYCLRNDWKSCLNLSAIPAFPSDHETHEELISHIHPKVNHDLTCECD